jgi:PqqD family protein of HPr-rel-A system
MMNLSVQETKPLRQSEILSQPLKDEMVLYPLEGKAIHVLNRTAVAIWELCDGNHTLAQIEAKVRERFVIQDPKADVATDIAQTLQELANKGLVRD